jgi:SulP family sulfate permease
LRFDRHELAGSVADVGVMIPLACGVAAAAHLSLVAVFLWVALCYGLTAVAFRLPMPVQPMKAMAASIIALGLSASVVSTAGIEIGIAFLLLAFTPLARYLARLFPTPVVRGIQLAIGLLLLKSALALADSKKMPGIKASLHVGDLTLTVGIVVAIVIAVVLVASNRWRRLPVSLVVLGLGAAVGLLLVMTGVSQLKPVAAGLSLPLAHASLHDAWIAFFALVLPQLPLSLGNAVFATEDVMGHYFGAAARRARPDNLCLSMGLINLGGGLVGGMSLCHGSGGATAHYRLGARTAGATILAAALYVVLAIGAGFGFSPLLIPGAVLAGMLLFVGIEHCLLVADLVTLDEIICAVLIAVTALVVNNLAIGFIVGWVAYTAMKHSRLRRVGLRWPTLTERLAPRPAPVNAR